ncbi:hypothetical protein B0H14DRAFT_2593531 [Mycena olivaceomarginata]|nr:hypothetical protein B0H14DRAFT_2593531 [Mycena olivaceomarginata]
MSTKFAGGGEGGHWRCGRAERMWTQERLQGSPSTCENRCFTVSFLSRGVTQGEILVNSRQRGAVSARSPSAKKGGEATLCVPALRFRPSLLPFTTPSSLYSPPAPRACIFPPFSLLLWALCVRSVWILFCSALVVVVIGEGAAEGCGTGSAPSDAEEKERDARRDAFAAEGRVRVYGRGANPLVRVAPYSYVAWWSRGVPGTRSYLKARRDEGHAELARAGRRARGWGRELWVEDGEAEPRTGRRRRRRDAWTVHSKLRARGPKGANPESKGRVERGV